MRQIIYDKVKYIADKYKGYIDTEDLMKEGLTNRQIGLLTAEGKLEKVAHGHYWIISPEFSKPEDYKAVEVARVNRKAVICADSACYYMGLIDKEPEILSIATRRSDRHKMKMNFDVCRHYFSEKAFEEDQKVFNTEYGTGTVTDRTVRRDLRRYCLCDGAYPWAERTERFFGCNLLLGILVCGYTAISASGFPSDERLADLNASRCGTCGCRRTVRNYGGLLSCTCERDIHL